MKPAFVNTLMVYLILLIAACGSGNGTQTDGGPHVVTCTTRRDCPDRQGCVDGVCGRCSRDRDCLVTEFCAPLDQLCARLPNVGDQCSLNDDCALGSFCVQGYCKDASQVTLCKDNSGCAAQQRCDAVNLVCEQDFGCNRDQDCSPGEVCDLGSSKCMTACTAETQELICGFGMVCNDQGRCVECFRDDQCGVGLHCNTGTNRCEGQNSCLTTRDCDPGQVCNPRTLQCTVPPPTCLSNDDCPSGSACDPTKGQCVSQDCRPDRFEPNDDPAHATPLGPGRTDGLNLCPGDRDWFGIQLARGDRLQVIVDTDFLAADHFQAVLFDPTAQRALQEDPLLLDTVVAQDGLYLLRTQTLDPQVDYNLIITVSRGIPCDDDSLEPNDGPTEASIVTAGTYRDLVLCPRNEDWYLMQRTLDQRLEVHTNFNALQGSLNLDLLAGDGRTLVMRSATAGNSQLVYVEQGPGTRFFARVYADPQTSNHYELEIDLLPASGGKAP